MFNETVANHVGTQFEAVSSMTQEQYVRVASNLMIAKMYSLAACVMLFYDMIITLGDEVEQIWMRKFSLLTVLWFLNRYLSPLGYIVIIVSFHDPWSKEVCDRYILYPEALKVVTTSVVGAIFIMRLHAIYSRSLFIIILGCALLTAELGLKIWAFTDGKSIDLPPGLVGCILVGTKHARFAVTWIAELGFDTAVFLLTLWKTFEHNWRLQGNATSLINLILRDGVMYYAIIFAANLLTVLLFMLAPPDIKAINASFSTLITSLMVSRVILNLRTAGITITQDSNIVLEGLTTNMNDTTDMFRDTRDYRSMPLSIQSNTTDTREDKPE